MKQKLLTVVNLFFLLPLLHQTARAEEIVVLAAGAAYAPLDVTKQDENAIVPLSVSQRQDLLGEFKGLVHMGLRKVSYSQWEGKDMADCVKPQNTEPWSLKCEILTGQGDGIYYFYPAESRRIATLQQVDIRVDAADDRLLEDFRRPIQELFGRGSLVHKPNVSAKTSGPIRRWNTGNDLVELFIDHSARSEGAVRFVWTRSPLVGGAQAWLRNLNTDN